MKKLALCFLVAIMAAAGTISGLHYRSLFPRYETIEKGKVIDFARDLEQKAHMNQVILFRSASDPLCLTKMTKNADVLEIGEDSFLITINKDIIDRFPDLELNTLIAHELGHVFWKHSREHPALNTDDDLGEVINRRQAQADAFAIHFVDENSVRKFLIKVDCDNELVYYRMREAKKIASN